MCYPVRKGVMTVRILVVEDEQRLAGALAQILQAENYHVDVAHTGADGLYYAKNSEYDLIILDVMLPVLDGFAVVRSLRTEKQATPVLLLTAKGGVRDKVQGLDSGADDYMTKPFSAEELLARVRALTRRQGEVILDTLAYRDLTLELDSYALLCGEQILRLSFKEFEVLRLLMSRPGIVTAKETLLIKVWGAESEAEDNNVEAYISFLRKKLSFLQSDVQIETIRKVGYRLK